MERDHTPPDKTSKKTKEVLCSVCNKKIPDTADEVEEPKEAVFCEGECLAWMHRQCAGVSLTMFSKIADSDESFKCMYCILKVQIHEIQQLKGTIKTLTDELEAVKCNRSQQYDRDFNPPPTSLGSDGDHQQNTAQRPLSHTPNPQQQIPTAITSQPRPRTTVSKRNFNVVIYGTSECPKHIKAHQI